MGSHMLRDQLEAFNGTANFILASNYLFYHAGGLLFTGLLLERLERRGFCTWNLFIVGSFLFCGSLFTYSLTGLRGVTAMAPIGGMNLILGWLTLVVTCVRLPSSKNAKWRMPMYLHGLSSIHPQKSWMINIAQLLVGLFFSSAYKPIDGSGTPLEAVQGEATGVGRLCFIERNPPTVGQRACRFATATTNLR